MDPSSTLRPRPSRQVRMSAPMELEDETISAPGLVGLTPCEVVERHAGHSAPDALRAAARELEARAFTIELIASVLSRPQTTRAVVQYLPRSAARVCQLWRRVLNEHTARVAFRFGSSERKSEADNASLVALVGACPNLVSIKIYDRVEHVSAATIIAIAPGLAHIQVIDCSYSCELLTDAALGAIAANCPSLRSVNVDSAFKLTDVGLLALSAGCRLLDSVNVTNTNITDLGVCALARLPELRTIKLADTVLTTDSCLDRLARSCPKLREVDIGE